jgi:glutamate-ammonia-ligase adenylyltransferase
VSYYEAWAAAWEKAAFMKARPVAGDEVLGWRTIRAAAPMIYRSNMDFTGVAAIKEMKAKIEKAKGRVDGPFNVKLGRGGIRDVEFVAQALQMLHGGKIPQVRGRSTQRAIVSLREVGVLAEADAEALLDAYHFLRRVENRLQMEAERQVHELPAEAQGLRRLARSMGFTEDPAGSSVRSNATGNGCARSSRLSSRKAAARVFSQCSRAMSPICSAIQCRGR